MERQPAVKIFPATEIAHEKTWTWLRKEKLVDNVKTEIRSEWSNLAQKENMNTHVEIRKGFFLQDVNI